MKKLSLKSINRTILGKNSCKKSRREGYIPAVVYSKPNNYYLNLDAEEVISMLRNNGENAVVDLNIDNNIVPVVIKEIQRHPVNDSIYHIDFIPIKFDEMIALKVPISYKNTENIRRDGGIIQSQKDFINVIGKPENIPKNINIDVSKYKINQTIRIKDIEISKELSINENIENVIASFTESNI